MKRVVIHPEAQKEFEEAIAYYGGHARTFTTEEDFRREIEAAITEITAHPMKFRFATRGWPQRRFGPTAKFRYLIYYSVDGESLTVVAIAHPSRRPGYWAERRF
jgi:plasmid stabilization system protein ParE